MALRQIMNTANKRNKCIIIVLLGIHLRVQMCHSTVYAYNNTTMNVNRIKLTQFYYFIVPIEFDSMSVVFVFFSFSLSIGFCFCCCYCVKLIHFIYCDFCLCLVSLYRS